MASPMKAKASRRRRLSATISDERVARSKVVARSDPIATLQQSLGNQEIQRLTRSGVLSAEIIQDVRVNLGNQSVQRLVAAQRPALFAFRSLGHVRPEELSKVSGEISPGILDEKVVQPSFQERAEDQSAPPRVRRRANTQGSLARTNGAVVQRHAVADELIEALGKGKPPPPYAKPLAPGPKLPEELVSLREDLKKYDGKPEDIHEFVLERWRPNLKLRKDEDFRFKSEVKQQGGSNTPAAGLRKWASGEGGKAMDVDIPGVHEFMAELFDVIQAKHQGTQVNELDLFHGHVVPNAANKDLAIVFHAKEYPREELGPGGSKEQMFKQAGIVRPGRDRFSVADPAMTERNFLWLLSVNQLWVLSDPERTGPAANPDFALLLQGNDQQGKQFGTVAETKFGTDILNVNYFPQHLEGPKGKQVFFAPKGQWAVLFALEKEFPDVSREEIKKVYEENNYSEPRTKECLRKKSATQPQPQAQSVPPPRAPQSVARQTNPVDQLAEMFPKFPRDLLKEILYQFQGNLEHATEALLNMS